MDNVIVTMADVSLAGQRRAASVHVANVAVLRVAVLMAGGSLLAAFVTLLSIAGDFPHPWHQVLAALATFVLGLIVVGSSTGISAKNHQSSFFRLGAVTLLVVALPLLRYVPPIYTAVYLQDLESLFPPLWPYSASIPLLMAVLGELALARRPRSAPVFLLAASLVPASMLLFFGSEVIQALATTVVAAALPWRTLLALSVCTGASALIVLGTAVATRGMVWTGVVVLLGVGLFLEIGSTFFYGIASPRLFNPGLPPISPWIVFAAGTVPGASALLISVMVVVATTSRRGPIYS